MEEEHLDCWEQFEERIYQLREERKEQGSSTVPLSVSGALFRGQSDADWHLATTLERSGPGVWSLREYYRLVVSIAPQIESLTKSRWELDSFEKITEWTSKMMNFQAELPPSCEFLIYLRHHGFPSPLLDWTQSPYIAAYFAFSEQDTERVAIYVYMEHFGQGKTASSARPLIVTIGPTVRGHSRHFYQKSEYSFAIKRHEQSWCYCSHEDVFAKGSQKQDRLWKITLPASERKKVLSRLDDHNLNSFTLFQTEEALLQAIWMRDMVLSKEFGPTHS